MRLEQGTKLNTIDSAIFWAVRTNIEQHTPIDCLATYLLKDYYHTSYHSLIGLMYGLVLHSFEKLFKNKEPLQELLSEISPFSMKNKILRTKYVRGFNELSWHEHIISIMMSKYSILQVRDDNHDYIIDLAFSHNDFMATLCEKKEEYSFIKNTLFSEDYMEKPIMKKTRTKTIHWVVDAQNDFMNKDGALYVEGAEDIKKNIQRNVQTFKDKNIQQVFTMDWHYENSSELSNNPDFIDTFPPHCMAETEGAQLIKEIYDVIDVDLNEDECIWSEFSNYQDLIQLCKNDNIIITKDAFDVFKGNKYTTKIVEIISPDIVYVSGVATNVCVNQAVLGLLERGIEVRVIVDSIKELPNLPVNEVIDNWVGKGARLV